MNITKPNSFTYCGTNLTVLQREEQESCFLFQNCLIERATFLKERFLQILNEKRKASKYSEKYYFFVDKHS